MKYNTYMYLLIIVITVSILLLFFGYHYFSKESYGPFKPKPFIKPFGKKGPYKPFYGNYVRSYHPNYVPYFVIQGNNPTTYGECNCATGIISNNCTNPYVPVCSNGQCKCTNPNNENDYGCYNTANREC